MFWTFRSPLTRLGLIVAISLLGISGQAPNPESGTVIKSSVREVVLDLSVRNKNGKMVRDLRQDEVEVLVDGVRQSLRSFQLVKGDEMRKLETPAPPAASSAPATVADKLPPPNSAREINLVALVFRTASTEERGRAQKAAMAFITGELRPHTYIAILTMTRARTSVAQSFTANRTVLAAAINRTLTNTGMHEPGMELAALVPPASPPATPVQGPTFPDGSIDSTNVLSSKLDASFGGDGTTRRLDVDARYTDFNTNAVFEMDQIRSVINQMAGIAGRKTVIAMVNTLATPPEQPEIFEKLIADARKKGVTFYGVNVSGLQKTDTFEVAQGELNNAAAVSQTQGKTAAVSRDQARNEDRILDLVRSWDTENALRVLSESTGGFLISNTNDVAHQMPRIMDEVNTHYEAAWTPAGSRYDGKFHRIEVRLKRAGMHADCRAGYYALPDLDGHSFQGYELTGLQVLDRKPLPKDFEFRARALRFGPSGEDWRGVIAFEAPIASFASIGSTGGAAGVEDLGSNLQVHADAVAIIRDPAGEITGMVSDRVAYQVPAGKKDGFMVGNLTMTLPVVLHPGHWTIEASMMLPGQETASARRISVFVPKPSTPSVSSIVLARRIEPRPSATDLLGPFDIGASRVTPTLADSVAATADSELYFVIYPSAEIEERPKVFVQYFRDGKEVGKDNPTVKSDGSGAIPMLTAAHLAPGEYEVRVTATQGPRAARESAWIRVVQ